VAVPARFLRLADRIEPKPGRRNAVQF